MTDAYYVKSLVNLLAVTNAQRAIQLSGHLDFQGLARFACSLSGAHMAVMESVCRKTMGKRISRRFLQVVSQYSQQAVQQVVQEYMVKILAKMDLKVLQFIALCHLPSDVLDDLFLEAWSQTKEQHPALLNFVPERLSVYSRPKRKQHLIAFTASAA